MYLLSKSFEGNFEIIYKSYEFNNEIIVLSKKANLIYPSKDKYIV